VQRAKPLIPEHTKLLKLKLLLKSYKDKNRLILIKFQHNRSKQEVIYFVLRSTDLLILFGISMNCHSSGKNQLFYIFINGAMKLTVVIIDGYHCYQLHKQFVQYSSLKFNPTCR
jgi:hypothetical protein